MLTVSAIVIKYGIREVALYSFSSFTYLYIYHFS